MSVGFKPDFFQKWKSTILPKMDNFQSLINQFSMCKYQVYHGWLFSSTEFQQNEKGVRNFD